MSESEYGQESFTAGWFIWLVRIVLVGISGFTLWGAIRSQSELGVLTTSRFTGDVGLFWQMVGLCAASGAAFCLAVRVPFPRPRLAWGRIVFLAAGLVPAIHWYLLTVVRPDVPSGILGSAWFDAVNVIQVGATLGGVGLASAVGARRGKR
jgi:hypothetical protein